MVRRAHDWAWHEARIADNEANGQVVVDGGRRISRQRWLAWRRQTMGQLDAEPEEFRRLVHEVNLAAATEQRRQAQVRQQAAEQCKHGRWRHKCPHCHYAAAKGRSGGVIERQAATDRAQAVLERARRRWDAE
jgi:ABC-type lipopolysaccharide export system ATPase subunit